MTAPTVSVVMPVYNAGNYLQSALESILAQTFSDFELIVIDDGSTDNSPAILKAFAQKDSRVHILTQPQNGGVIRALNSGLQQAAGQYIARMDADDISLPGRFEEQVAFLAAHPEVGLLGTAATVMDAAGRPRGALDYPLTHALLQWTLCFYDPIIHPTIMARREVLLAAGGYRSDRPHTEDYDLFALLSFQARFANLPGRLLLLRKHDGNVSHVHQKRQMENAAAISQEMLTRLSGCRVPVSPLDLAQSPRRISRADLQALNTAILGLRDHFLAQPELSRDEVRFIRRETGVRLARLMIHAPGPLAMLEQALFAQRCHPLAFPALIAFAFKKIFPSCAF